MNLLHSGPQFFSKINIWINKKTIKFNLIKLATDFYTTTKLFIEWNDPIYNHVCKTAPKKKIIGLNSVLKNLVSILEKNILRNWLGIH